MDISPDILRKVCYQVPDLIDEDNSPNRRIFNRASPDQLEALLSFSVPTATPRPFEDVLKALQEIFSFRAHVDDPRFLSHVPSPVSRASWLGDMLSSSYNAFASNFEAASGVTTIEVSLIRWLATQVGLPSTAGGLFVSGGSIANLTALTVARDQLLEKNTRGIAVAYMSDQTHFSIPKALRILGFFESQIRIIPTKLDFSLDLEKLEQTIDDDMRQGLRPFLIVANFGSTNTGSIDPLDLIADLACKHGMWAHVDGAYGASVALSRSHRDLIAGLGRMNSMAWDAHKWLFQTFGCGMVFVREKAQLAMTFAANGEYIQDLCGGDDAPDLWNYGIELTRPARHMRLWFSLQVLGLDTIGRMIDHGFMLAETAEESVRRLPQWTIISPAKMAIVNIRFCPAGRTDEELDELNKLNIVARNIAVIFTTRLAGKITIRICSINPRLTKQSMHNIIQELDATARRLLHEA